MPAKINLLNQQFGNLLVIAETDKRKNKSVVWKCQCACGNIVELSTKELRSDGVIQCPHCGHNRKPVSGLTEDIIGKKFNHLTVVEKTEKRSGGKILYKCICDCDNQTEVLVTRTDLQNNSTISCGCSKRKYKIGDIINNREVIGYIGSQSDGHYYYQCKCLLCNRIYNALAQTLDKTCSCGCQKSIGEFNIIQILNRNNIKYIKEYCFPQSQLRFDFAIINDNQDIIRLIEFDGEQHYEHNVKNSGWNTYEKYQYTFQHDQLKTQLAKDKGIPLIRIPYWERDNITLEMLLNDKYLIL